MSFPKNNLPWILDPLLSKSQYLLNKEVKKGINEIVLGSAKIKT